MTKTRTPLPTSEGLDAGRAAAVASAAAQGTPVSRAYQQMLNKAGTYDALPSSSVLEGTVMHLPQVQGVSMDPLPLATYEKYNMSIDPKMFISNLRPYNYDEYSIVNYALAPNVAFTVDANPTTVEQMKGGAIASGRGYTFMGERIPTEIKKYDYDPATVLDAVTSVYQIAYTTQSMKNSRKKYAKGLKQFGTRYGLDPASVFGGQSEQGPTESAEGEDVPMVTSDNKDLGTIRVPHAKQPRGEQEGSKEAFGYTIESLPDKSLVPMVRVANYDGFDTYERYANKFESGGSAQQMRYELDSDRGVRRPMRRDMSPFQLYMDAWKTSDRTPLQTTMVVVTIVVAVLVAAMVVWGLVALARPRPPCHTYASRGPSYPAEEQPKRVDLPQAYSYQPPRAKLNLPMRNTASMARSAPRAPAVESFQRIASAPEAPFASFAPFAPEASEASLNVPEASWIRRNE